MDIGLHIIDGFIIKGFDINIEIIFINFVLRLCILRIRAPRRQHSGIIQKRRARHGRLFGNIVTLDIDNIMRMIGKRALTFGLGRCGCAMLLRCCIRLIITVIERKSSHLISIIFFVIRSHFTRVPKVEIFAAESQESM